MALHGYYLEDLSEGMSAAFGKTVTDGVAHATMLLPATGGTLRDEPCSGSHHMSLPPPSARWLW